MSTDIDNVVVLASGITNLQVEEVDPNKVRINCPSPDGPFVLAHIYSTLASIKGNRFSLQVHRDKQIQAIELEGKEVELITKGLLCLGDNHWIRFSSGWGIIKGSSP